MNRQNNKIFVFIRTFSLLLWSNSLIQQVEVIYVDRFRNSKVLMVNICNSYKRKFIKFDEDQYSGLRVVRWHIQGDLRLDFIP